MIAAIPEDIDRIATDLVRNPYVGCDDPEYEMYLAIARALQSERARCADIAFDVMFDVAGAPMARVLQRRILANPDQPPTGE